ncbi:MAG: hypothetical protein N3A65_03035 [candidate division WOR-3 bacterium]|nr:hypothetical protein [candidate division WOR-3 bacterium]
MNNNKAIKITEPSDSCQKSVNSFAEFSIVDNTILQKGFADKKLATDRPLSIDPNCANMEKECDLHPTPYPLPLLC